MMWYSETVTLVPRRKLRDKYGPRRKEKLERIQYEYGDGWQAKIGACVSICRESCPNKKCAIREEELKKQTAKGCFGYGY